MHWLIRFCRTGFGLAALATIHAHALYTEIPPPGSLLVMNLPAQATLSIGATQQVLKGQISVHGSFTAADIKAGVIKLGAFNLTLPDVDQTALTGLKPKRGGAKSVLGIALSASKSAPALKYDDATGVASGHLPVSIDFAQLEELFPSREAQDPKEPDAYDMKKQLGTLTVQIKFDQPLSKTLLEKVSKRYGSVQMKLDANPIADAFGKILVNRYLLDFTRVDLIPIDIGGFAWFEVGRRLCIQPVRIRSSIWDFNPTGAGLAFGQPGANAQWAKADVVFDWRPWMTVTNAGWKIATGGNSAEEADIRASVNEANCIEVFFVQNFDPVDSHGGGATWSSGTASAKIISSDGNAVNGVDFTHLAHELGHVLNLGHPNAPGSLSDSSTNSLMCPSGWNNDNPPRNSQWNKDHVSNPLLQFIFKVRSPGPDCNHDPDCGACP